MTAQPWLSTWPVAGIPTYRAHDTEAAAEAHVATLKVTGYPLATVMWGGEPELDPRLRVGGVAS